MLWFLLTITLILIWSIAAFLGLPGAAPSDRIDHIKNRLINWYKKPTDPVRIVAYGALGLSLFTALWGAIQTGAFPGRLIEDFYANGAAELASIAITVLIIDRLTEWRAEQRYKSQVLEQLRANVNANALEAVRISRRRGWLEDGSLKGLNLSLANLSGALMFNTDLEGAKLIGTSLSGVSLGGANLRHAYLSDADAKNGSFLNADFYDADLENANLERADLRNTILEQASLRDANLSWADLRGASLANADLNMATLEGASYSHSTIWPEGFDPATNGAILVEDDEQPL
ncbi:MAG: pentapeptide repeat-containing protein [Chloroflexota bacterium]